MVRRVAGHMQYVEGEAPSSDGIAIGKRAVRHEVGIHEIVAEAWRAGAPRRSGRPERGDLSAGKSLQAARALAMIAMTMGDEDISQVLAFDGVRYGLEMVAVGRAGVDHGDLSAADHITIGAEERVRAGIIGNDAPDVGRDLLGDAVVHILTTIESKLRRHGLLSCWSSRRSRADCSGARGRRQRRPFGSVNFSPL